MDMPLRTGVYPSYNYHDLNKNAVLRCSYAWFQDAIRAGSLISPDSSRGKKDLRELMFDDRAKLRKGSFVNKTRAEIRALNAEACVTHHAFSWRHDLYTSGAFALVCIALVLSFPQSCSTNLLDLTILFSSHESTLLSLHWELQGLHYLYTLLIKPSPVPANSKTHTRISRAQQRISNPTWWTKRLVRGMPGSLGHWTAPIAPWRSF